ncbi:cytochrome c class I [Shewanella halifaxensis HAW-EB4]|uniref:Cytochrome c class I n=1 Tax=Shewanella halifaxensis (strain HAW-EB4) TaxID=458817 RepID=B0TIQ7_SHEHH|nr:c-type cytochrome [Shewanella halifaxensis]ABZ75602.1 cytochrome c class I [Shewanella halifaxensis HAW-EB4]
MSVKKNKLAAFVVLSASMAGFNSQAFAEDDQKLLNMCIACHGVDGSNDFASIPNLKGQNVQYMVGQLKNFKTDKRQDKTMSKVAKLLTEEQMQAMAVYFNTGKEQD